ncbi:MAG: ChaN family lipoprotein [Bacteroidota bacterium]|nr:ChaN family lipoprotein [Bacteroidota bacterium]
MKNSLVIILISLIGFAFKSDKPAYVLYTGEGKVVKYEKMMKELEKADLVFFGELHDDPIGHWLEYEITKDLFESKQQDLVLAAEMFESDVQVILTEYLNGNISMKSFESEARIWPNYKTDYKPLVEFAKDNELFFVASNVPRRYASVVHKGGFEALDSLSDEAKQFLPPLPVPYDATVKCYADMLNMQGMGGHVNENFPKAQAIKDATMAHFIMKNWSEGKLTIHYNGSYHSNNFQGIIWYIRQSYPDLNILTIANEKQDDLNELNEDNLNIASYIVCVHSSMTSTR